MINKLIIVLIVIASSFNLKLYSQCCSMGTPASNSDAVGVLKKNHLRFNYFYRYNFLDTYFEGNNHSSQQGMVEKSIYNFKGITIAYGLTDRLTLVSENGYFINKTQFFNFNEIESKLRGYGMTNGFLSVLYSLLNDKENKIELTSGLGVKYPYTLDPLFVDGVRIPVDLQPSTNAFGITAPFVMIKTFKNDKLRLISNNRFEYNFRNQENYKYGKTLSNSLILSNRFTQNFSGIGILRHDYRWSDEGNSGKAINTGAQVIVGAFVATYNFASSWNVTAQFEIPIYQSYVGRQLGLKYSYGIGLNKKIGK